jgi:demethylmenaquinone methyltransferase/2-methoxy-6-polyprenyl-1,4-benzoquinol methylase
MTGRADDVEGRERLVASFFEGTGSTYDLVVQVFTLGLDSSWKREILDRVPPSKRILDLGCGTGIVSQRLARRFPEAEIVGVDVTEDYLAIYEERLRGNRRTRGRSMLGNAETLSLEGEFDTVVSSYLAKYVDSGRLLSNVAHHINPGGTFIAHDFNLPTNRVCQFAWQHYNRAINSVGGALFPRWRTVFDGGLAGLIRESRWFDLLPEALSEHGFVDVQRKLLSFECAGLVWARKKS